MLIGRQRKKSLTDRKTNLLNGCFKQSDGEMKMTLTLKLLESTLS